MQSPTTLNHFLGSVLNPIFEIINKIIIKQIPLTEQNTSETIQKLKNIQVNLQNPQVREQLINTAESYAEIGSEALQNDKLQLFIEDFLNETSKSITKTTALLGDMAVNTVQAIPFIGAGVSAAREVSDIMQISVLLMKPYTDLSKKFLELYNELTQLKSPNQVPIVPEENPSFQRGGAVRRKHMNKTIKKMQKQKKRTIDQTQQSILQFVSSTLTPNLILNQFGKTRKHKSKSIPRQ